MFARNGVEALDRLNEDQNIGMVLSDINMPEMDGLTLLEQIPTVNPDIHAVVVSAYGDMENIRMAMNRGAFDFVIKPIDFEDLQLTIRRTLEHLAQWRAALEARDKLVALENELDIANRMQQSILPTKFPEAPDYQVFASMEPARDVGGDFFDVLRLPDGRIGLVVADVSGKGVPAALFMMSICTLIKGAAVSHSDPSEILRQANHLLCENNDALMFVTVFLAVFDPASDELVYVNGGHNPPIIFHAAGNLDAVAVDRRGCPRGRSGSSLRQACRDPIAGRHGGALYRRRNRGGEQRERAVWDRPSARGLRRFAAGGRPRHHHYCLPRR